MTKDVLISFCGMQSDMGTAAKDKTETVVSGLYYEKNNRHYVLYDEKMEGLDQPVKTKLKFGTGILEIIRSGALGVRMVFEENKKNMADYNTPYGNILLGISTKKIHISQQPDTIEVNVDYTLEADNKYLSDCSINMKIQSI